MKDLFAPAGQRRRAGKLRLPIDPHLSVRPLEERRVFHAGPLVPGPESQSPENRSEFAPPPTTSVSLDGQQNLQIEQLRANSHSDQLTIRFDAHHQRYEIFDPTQLLTTEIEGAIGSGTHRLYIPYEVVGGEQLIVRTGGGDDSLTLDYSAGDSPLSIVFDGGGDYHARINDPSLGIDENCILVMRGAGVIGWPGSAEVVNMQPPDALLQRGIEWLPTLGDGRQSGTSDSPSASTRKYRAAD